MPNYKKLFEQAIFQLDRGIKVFAGTTDDEFYIDLGAAFNSLNFRKVPGPGSTGVPAVLSPQQDRAKVNFVSDDVSGFNVNTIALQVPITLLTRGGNRPAASNPDATLGTYGATLRRQTETRDPLQPIKGDGDWVQVQRMGNPLFNELIIGTGFKDLWSRSDPKDDAQFAAFALDPLIARVAQAAYSAIGVKLTIPTPPRADLLPLVTYAPPIATPGPDAAGDRRPAAGEHRRSRRRRSTRRAASACSGAMRPASPTAAARSTMSPTSCCGSWSAACWPPRSTSPRTTGWATASTPTSSGGARPSPTWRRR